MIFKFVKVMLFVVICFASFSAHAVIENCDKKVSFNNGNTYKNITGTINCTLRKNPRIKTQSVTFVNGKKHGKAITYGGYYGRKNAANNHVAMVENFHNGEHHGKYIIYDDKNPALIKTERDYQNGLLLREMNLSPFNGGKSIYYYQIYNKKGKTETRKRSKKIGSLSYNKAGQLKNKSCPKTASNIVELNKVCGFTGGQQAVTLRDDEGKITTSAVIKKGQTQERKTFYPSGKLRTKATKNRHQVFYESGKIQQEKINKAGNMIIQKTYYPSGKPETMERFVNRLLTEERSWYMNGKPKYVSLFQANTRRTMVQRYYGNGKLEEKYTAARDKRKQRIYVGAAQSFYENGKPRSQSNYDNKGNLLNEKRFYPNGKLSKFTQVAADGSKMVKDYNKNGILEKTASYYSDGSVK